MPPKPDLGSFSRRQLKYFHGSELMDCHVKIALIALWQNIFAFDSKNCLKIVKEDLNFRFYHLLFQSIDQYN